MSIKRVKPPKKTGFDKSKFNNTLPTFESVLSRKRVELISYFYRQYNRVKMTSGAQTWMPNRSHVHVVAQNPKNPNNRLMWKTIKWLTDLADQNQGINKKFFVNNKRVYSELTPVKRLIDDFLQCVFNNYRRRWGRIPTIKNIGPNDNNKTAFLDYIVNYESYFGTSYYHEVYEIGHDNTEMSRFFRDEHRLREYIKKDPLRRTIELADGKIGGEY